jgi:hypothetical protein
MGRAERHAGQTVLRAEVSPENTVSLRMASRIWLSSTEARSRSNSLARLGAQRVHRLRSRLKQVSSTQLLHAVHRVKSGMISLAAFSRASSRPPRSMKSLALRAALDAPQRPPMRLLAPESIELAVPMPERMNSLL